MSLRAADGALGVHHPRGVQRHEPRRLHLRGRVGDPVLHRLLLGQHAALRLAVGRALAEHVEGAPRDAQPAHAVMDAPGAEAVLGDEEAGAGLAQQRLGAEVDVLVEDLGVVAELAVGLGAGAPSSARRARSSRPGVSTGTMNIEARWWGRASGSVTAMTMRKSAIEAFEENHLWPLRTQPSPSRSARVRSSVGSEPALSGSVIEKADFRSPASSGCSQRSFCSSVPASARISRVARVGRLVAERVGRERRRAQDLVHEAELDLAEALPAEVGRQVRGPQPAALDLLLQRRVDAVERRLVELGDDRLQRPDLLAHEGAHPVQLLFELGLGREVPRHAVRRPQSRSRSATS